MYQCFEKEQSLNYKLRVFESVSGSSLTLAPASKLRGTDVVFPQVAAFLPRR